MIRLGFSIEISYRQAHDIQDDDTTVTDGVRVYKIEKPAEFKAGAFLFRLKARDIFDMDFLLTKFPDAVSNET